MKTPKAAILLALSLLACDNAEESTTGLTRQASLGVALSATGGGFYVIPVNVPIQFSFSASQRPDGEAAGEFHIAFSDSGFEYDINGTVTCMASEPSTGRAWIGGVVTSNTSTDPDLQTDIHEVGDDVWFRVLDAGEGHGAVDRTSFLGFEGAAGLTTSAEYCAARIWPDDNARTWPVINGNISVR